MGPVEATSWPLKNLLDELDIMLCTGFSSRSSLSKSALRDRVESGVEWLQRSFTVKQRREGWPGRGDKRGISRCMLSVADSRRVGGSPFTDAAEVSRENRTRCWSTYLLHHLLRSETLTPLSDSLPHHLTRKLLSTPVVLTTDNTEAKVVIGEERPIVTSTSTTDTGTQTSSFEYRKHRY